MDFHAYQELANRTAKPMTLQGNLLHAALGLSGEVGEFVDTVKREFVYGQALDVDNLQEELGDILWFVALACETLHVNMGDIAAANIDKLATRYPGTYTDHHAAERADKAPVLSGAEA